MEAPKRIELLNNGFAIRSLSHLGTAPEPENRQSRRNTTSRSHGRQQELGHVLQRTAGLAASVVAASVALAACGAEEKKKRAGQICLDVAEHRTVKIDLRTDHTRMLGVTSRFPSTPSLHGSDDGSSTASPIIAA